MWRISFSKEDVIERLSLYTTLNCLLVSGKYNKVMHGSAQDIALTYFLRDSDRSIVDKFLSVISSYKLEDLFNELYRSNFELYKSFWIERTPWKDLQHLAEKVAPIAQNVFESHVSDIFNEVSVPHMVENMPSDEEYMATSISVEDELVIAILIMNTDIEDKLIMLDWRENYEDEREYDNYEGRTDSLDIKCFMDKAYSNLAKDLELSYYEKKQT